MSRLRIKWLVGVILLLSLQAGCATSDSAPGAISASTLSPYATQTSAVASVLPTIVITPSPAPTPAFTPAPVSYTVIPGDTLSSIAKRFGTSLDVLLAANPGVAPQSLSIGTVIVIPGTSNDAGSSLLSPPVPIKLDNIHCFSSGGKTTCFVAVPNPYPEALENVKVQITLVDEGGQIIADQEAILPLDILPAGQVLPALAIFKELNTFHSARALLLGSVRLRSGDSRYRKTVLQNTLVSISWNGLAANVQGQIFVPSGEKPVGMLRLVAIAYDSSGQMNGFRRWEWTGSLQPGGFIPFETTVYSLGVSIEHVEVLVEALP
jgi:LysM repeat protein